MMKDFKERLKKLYRYSNNIPNDPDELNFVSKELFDDLCELRIPFNFTLPKIKSTCISQRPHQETGANLRYIPLMATNYVTF